MKSQEFTHIIIAIIILSIVIGFSQLIEANVIGFGNAILFAFILIAFNVAAKKLIALKLDASVEHKIWHWSRFGLNPGWRTKKPIPLGVILPLIFTAFSVGTFKLMTLLTYDTFALKRRAARRHGHYSYTEMTDWHNSLIGAAGILIILIISFVSYFSEYLEPLARFAAFYAFFNMLPISKLDGTQIYAGSRMIWYVLGAITLIFIFFALFSV